MAVTINRYNKFPEYFGDNTIDLDGDTFKAALGTGHSFVATNSVYADVSGDALATGNGYTAPGQNLSSVTWSESGGTLTFDAADVTWTASGGAIAASDAWIYSDTPTSPADPLAFNIDFDGTESAGDGTDFLLTFDAAGIFTLADAA